MQAAKVPASSKQDGGFEEHRHMLHIQAKRRQLSWLLYKREQD